VKVGWLKNNLVAGRNKVEKCTKPYFATKFWMAWAYIQKMDEEFFVVGRSVFSGLSGPS